MDALKGALSRKPAAPGVVYKRLYDLNQELLKLDEQLNGNRSKDQIGEKGNPTINSRLSVAMSGTMSSTYGPTPTHQRCLAIAKKQFNAFKENLEKIINERLPKLEKAMQDAGAPWVDGQTLPQG